MSSELPDVHFGTAESSPVDWRKIETDNNDDNDEELEKTPQDVIDMLGFDPKSEE